MSLLLSLSYQQATILMSDCNSLAASVLGREQANMLLHHCCSYVHGTVLKINLSSFILLAFPCRQPICPMQYLTSGSAALYYRPLSRLVSPLWRT